MFRLACYITAVEVRPDLDVNGTAYYSDVKAQQLFIFWEVVTRIKFYKSLEMLHTGLKLKSFKQSSENNLT